ncbi:MAG: hypothetical protein U9P14_09030, partial [Gemmatimonadota bacterium]|nr:hypothetical protein [Gemmatimonadota bacterium]
MQFKLKINPGAETRKFLEARIEALRRAELEDGLVRLKDDIRHIFSGRFDKLKKDPRFVKGFLNKGLDLRGEKTSLGETLIGAFALLDRMYESR